MTDCPCGCDHTECTENCACECCLDGCELDFTEDAIPEGEELFYALAPDGDPAKLEAYKTLFGAK